MFKFIVICILLYLAFIVLRWAFTDNKGRSRRSSGGGFFDGFGDGDGGGDGGGGGD
jgi:uncharacterized membrane protein YgcG